MLDLLPRDTSNRFPHQLQALVKIISTSSREMGTGWANNYTPTYEHLGSGFI